jgi:hypothetical protein
LTGRAHDNPTGTLQRSTSPNSAALLRSMKLKILRARIVERRRELHNECLCRRVWKEVRVRLSHASCNCFVSGHSSRI